MTMKKQWNKLKNSIKNDTSQQENTGSGSCSRFIVGTAVTW